MIHLQVTVANAAELLDSNAYGAGALLRWESGLAATGPFTEGGTVALVATTLIYDIWDPAGVVGTWYRTRISNAAPTTYSAFSDPFEGGAVTRYAELDQLLGLFETKPTQPARIVRLASLLDTATSQVIDECDGRDYFRHPATGTATWVADGNGSSILHLHDGLISLSLLEMSFNAGTSYVTVPSTDYTLRGDNPYSGEPVPTREPYFHVRLTGFGSYTTFPPMARSMRLTGARGWPALPAALVEGTAQRARQLAYAGGGYDGSNPGGPDEFGRPSSTDRFWPQSLYNFIQGERERFRPCYLGGRPPEMGRSTMYGQGRW